jgi:hypothetical protein
MQVSHRISSLGAHPFPDPFVAGLVLNHGPIQLLGRLLLAADTAARERGVFLSFATLEELVAINRANRATWRPLLPVFDPACAQLDPTSAICLLGRNAAGDVVVTQGARFFDWHGTTLHDEATSLRLLYRDPGAWRQPDEAIQVTAPTARLITGNVAYTGAHWCHADFRGKGLPTITPRIARALAIALWDVDTACTLMVEDVFARGVARRAGYLNAEWSIELKNTPLGTLTTALLWSRRDEIVADLENFLADLADADANVIERHA